MSATPGRTTCFGWQSHPACRRPSSTLTVPKPLLNNDQGQDAFTSLVASALAPPGYEATAPAVLVIYPWSDDLRTELRGLGVGK